MWMTSRQYDSHVFWKATQRFCKSHHGWRCGGPCWQQCLHLSTLEVNCRGSRRGLMMALNWFSTRCSNDFITTDVRATGLHSLTRVVLVLDGRGWWSCRSRRWEKRERNPLAARANSPGLQFFTPESHRKFLIAGPHTPFFLCFAWFCFLYSSTRVLPRHRPGNFKVETARKIHIFPKKLLLLL